MSHHQTKQYTPSLQWAEAQLAKQLSASIIQAHEIELKSYSIVLKIETNCGVFYLKQTPQDLFLEPDTIAYLAQSGCNHIPQLIAKNETLLCFLMSSCGEITLRRFFDGKAKLEPLEQGIKQFTAIQRRLEHSVPAMLKLGIPDWRLETFGHLYQQLVENESLLLNDGMTKQEIKQLQHYGTLCKELCAQLSNLNLPQTINHSDFHENNMVLDKQTGEVNLIDWGETVITHPFFSLCGCLWNVTFFQDIKKDSPRYKQLQLCCLDAWLDGYNHQTLDKAFNIANQISGVFAALGYLRMYVATHHLENNVQQMHPGSIAGCLRTFLRTLSSLRKIT